MYTTLSIVLLCLEGCLIGFFVFKTIKNRKAFSKKTPWYAVPVFILVYCLYIIGYIYTGKELTFFVILKMIPTTLEAFVFKVDVGIVTELSRINRWYFVAAIIATLLAGTTLVASVVGLWGAKLSNSRRITRAIMQGKEFVLGDSEEALSYAKKNGAIVVTFGGNDSVKKLIEQKYTVLTGNFSKENKLLKRRFDGRKSCPQRFLTSFLN